MTPLLGIDASKHQGVEGMSHARFDELTKRDIRFGAFRASIGTHIDPSFDTNRKRADHHDWVAGFAYHALVRGDAEVQAATFLTACRETGGLRGLITAVDVEPWDPNADGDPDIDSPRWRDVRQFFDAFREEAPRHPLGIYTGPYAWAVCTGNADGAEIADFLWLADWRHVAGPTYNATTLPKEGPRTGFGGWHGPARLWQYGPFRAGGKGIDGDAWYGTPTELRELAVIPRPPLEERPAYVKAHDLLLAEAMIGLPSVEADLPRVARLGAVAAYEEAIEALEALRIGGRVL